MQIDDTVFPTALLPTLEIIAIHHTGYVQMKIELVVTSDPRFPPPSDNNGHCGRKPSCTTNNVHVYVNYKTSHYRSV